MIGLLGNKNGFACFLLEIHLSQIVHRIQRWACKNLSACASEYDLEDCFRAVATSEAFRYGVINHRPSSDVNFFVNATVSSLSAD